MDSPTTLREQILAIVNSEDITTEQADNITDGVLAKIDEKGFYKLVGEEDLADLVADTYKGLMLATSKEIDGEVVFELLPGNVNNINEHKVAIARENALQTLRDILEETPGEAKVSDLSDKIVNTVIDAK